jgi:hypothetical protein
MFQRLSYVFGPLLEAPKEAMLLSLKPRAFRSFVALVLDE